MRNWMNLSKLRRQQQKPQVSDVRRVYSRISRNQWNTCNVRFFSFWTQIQQNIYSTTQWMKRSFYSFGFRLLIYVNINMVVVFIHTNRYHKIHALKAYANHPHSYPYANHFTFFPHHPMRNWTMHGQGLHSRATANVYE